MGRITDLPPRVTNAGQGHDYTGEPVEEVIFVSVPMDAGYTHAPLNRAGVDALIATEVAAGRAWQPTGVRWFYPDVPMQLAISTWDFSQYNYLRVRLPGGRYWYSFVSGSYHNKTTTLVDVKTDAWTTYDWSLGYGAFSRGHAGLAAAQGDTRAREFTESEPVEVGEMEAIQVDMFDLFEGGINVVVVSTTDLATTTPFRPHSLMPEAYVPLPMGDITQNQQRGADEFPKITTHHSGNIPGGGVWPFPLQPYAYDAGVFLPTDEVEPMPWPWVNGNEAQVPSLTPIAPSLINGAPADGGVFVYAGLREFARHMSVLAHTPWIIDGIVSAFVVPAGLFGAPGTTTGASPESLQNRGYDTTMSLVTGAASLAAYKPSVSYSNTVNIPIRSNWRSLYSPGIYTKLVSSQFAAVEFTDRQGSVTSLPVEQLPDTISLTVQRYQYGQSGEAAVSVNGLPSSGESPMFLGWSSTLPEWRNGRDDILGRQASSWLTDRSQRVFSYISEIRDRAYALYSAQAQDGYVTAIHWSAGKINSALGG